MVGLSAMTFQFNTARRIAEFIKSLHRDIKIVIGGYHATLMYEEIASSDNGKPFDYIVRGEGEKTFRDMLDAIEGKQKWEDIPVLINYFLDNFCRNRQKKILLPEAMTAMTQYHWPGNVRELKNTIERLVVMTEGNSISIEDLPENIRLVSSTTAEGTEVILSGVEKKHILKVLHEKQGNKTLAAEALGISLKTLYNKLKVYHIDV